MRIAVQGGMSLRGNYYPSGNSNGAIAALAVAMLTEAPVVLRNVPNTLSTTRMLELAQSLGSSVSRQTPSMLRLETAYVQSRVLDYLTTDRFPASVLFLAAIISRRHYARLEWAQTASRLYPHLTALRDLGLALDDEGTAVNITAEAWDTREIVLTWPSVTATALACMLAAVLGQKTIIYNAASEPHLRAVQQMLVQMGARVDGIGSNLVTVYGIDGEPGGADVNLPPDHIEIASAAAIGAITEGLLSIHNVHLSDLRMILKVYERLGVQYYLEGNDSSHILHVPDQENMQTQPIGEPTLLIDTAPWPGYPSDLVAMTALLATQVRGTTLIHEKLFDNRLLFTDKLKAMGAQVLLCDPHRVVVIGKSRLRGEYIDSPDVRVGMALLGAALCAEGESIIDNAQLIERNFEGVIEKLTQLGAHIEVV